VARYYGNLPEDLVLVSTMDGFPQKEFNAIISLMCFPIGSLTALSSRTGELRWSLSSESPLGFVLSDY